jgi:hypothetical protein
MCFLPPLNLGEDVVRSGRKTVRRSERRSYQKGRRNVCTGRETHLDGESFRPHDCGESLWPRLGSMCEARGLDRQTHRPRRPDRSES